MEALGNQASSAMEAALTLAHPKAPYQAIATCDYAVWLT